MMQNKHTTHGFSLVETLVAITILLIVITGPMTIVVNATRGTSVSADQVIAYYLAQEGAELAQKARDDILVPYFSATPPAGSAWDTFTDTSGPLADCYDPGNFEGCGMTINTDSAGSLDIVDCTSTGRARTNCRLYLESDLTQRATYTHDDTAATTVFRRVIELQETVADEEVRVTSTVFWRSGDQFTEQRAQVVTYLYNIYGR